MPKENYGDFPNVPKIENAKRKPLNIIHGEHPGVPAEEAITNRREEAKKAINKYLDPDGDTVPLGIG